MRHLALAAVAAIVPASAALAGEASTVRIEPRPYYGATVTLEEGVRVFRPLPPHKTVIINPGQRTPVSLGFNETIEHSYHKHNHQHSGGVTSGGGGAAGLAVPYGYGYGDRGHGDRGHGRKHGGKATVGRQ